MKIIQQLFFRDCILFLFLNFFAYYRLTKSINNQNNHEKYVGIKLFLLNLKEHLLHVLSSGSLVASYAITSTQSLQSLQKKFTGFYYGKLFQKLYQVIEYLRQQLHLSSKEHDYQQKVINYKILENKDRIQQVEEISSSIAAKQVPAFGAAKAMQHEITYHRLRELIWESTSSHFQQLAFQPDATNYGKFFYPNWIKITGLPLAEDFPRDLRHDIHFDDCQRQRKLFSSIAANKDYGNYNIYCLTKTGLETCTKVGDFRYLEVHAGLIRDAKGKIMGTCGTVKDIGNSEQGYTIHQPCVELKPSRELYLTALVKVQRRLLSFDGSPNCYTEILETLGSVCQASRIYVFHNHQSESGDLLVSQIAEWCAANVEPQIDNPALQNLPYQKFVPRWVELLSRGEIISQVVAELPPCEREILEPQGILSILVLPIIAKGKLLGLIGFDNCLEARMWEPVEVDLLQAAAAAISLAQERYMSDLEMQSCTAYLEVKVQERTAELQREIAERQRTEKEFEKLLSLQRATLEATADGILVIGKKGNIAGFNRKFLSMWGIPESLMTTDNYKKALKFALNKLKNPEEFLRTIKELNADVDAQIYDAIEFQDGRIFERYSQPQRIGSKIVGRVWSFRDVTAHKIAEETIRHQALHDLLTNLPNRVLFNDRLSVALAQAHQNKGLLAVCFLDLDRFKTINDTLGHAVGDRLLQLVTERLKTCLREGDTIARWGGDEFTLLLPGINNPEEVSKIAQRILEVLKPAFDIEEHHLHISSSIGIAFYPRHGEDAETLIKNADAALYRAKSQGRNNYQFYNSAINSQASELLLLENRLHHALDRGEFTVYYQPQVNTSTGEITKMEALVRWQHPQLGLVPPGQFIPLAEENGLIVPIGEWVLRTACAQNKAWQDTLGLPSLCVAVNLSARQFQQPNLVTMVKQILQETQLAPQCLELEITETVAMQNVDFTKAILSEFNTMGVTISIDDFGTGYSSLNYLKKFPLHILKVDKSFVRDLTTNPNDAAIANAIIGLAHGLHLDVVAEGVETEEQQNLLRSLNCELMQGHFFSRAITAEDATQLLQQFPTQAIKSKVFPNHKQKEKKPRKIRQAKQAGSCAIIPLPTQARPVC
jgi:diguanylate cyclase (GGDEF)-like protein